MILSYHAVPTEEEMFFISRPLLGEPFFLKISETFCFCVARGGTSVVY